MGTALKIVFAAGVCYTSGIMDQLWTAYLYRPVFNFLIWIYNHWTNQNLGWAVIYLTIVLRTALLPFTLVTERNRVHNEALVEELRRVEKAYPNDPILRKEEMRRVIRKRRVQPWAKVITLGVQIIFFVLLYQVFIRGVNGDKILRFLYPSVDFPGVINTNFYGFELGLRNTYFWPGVVTVILFIEIYLEFHKRKNGLMKADLAYFILFPLFVFVFLWWLPLVKSIFILTSMIYSYIIGWLARGVFRKKETVH